MRLKLSNNKSSKKIWFNFGKRQFFMALYKKPAILTQGITNETADGWYVPFIDYDQVNLDKVIREARRLIGYWKLSGFVLLATKETLAVDGTVYGNYHLLGFDKLTFHDHIDMLRMTCCDPNFVRMPQYFRYRHWVLRIMPKLDGVTKKPIRPAPYIKCWIKGVKHRIGEQSYAHYTFMRKYYGLMRLTMRWDRATGIQIIRYNTTSG